MMRGMPRNTSVYAAASTRTGKNTAPRRVRRSAMTVAKTATVTTESPRTCRLSRNPSHTRGSDDQNVSGSKNDRCTSAHPGVLRIVSQTTAANASVETRATNTDRVD